MDPRAVRCGIDDRPRNVLGADTRTPLLDSRSAKDTLALAPDSRGAKKILAEAVAGMPAPRRPIRPIDMAPEPIPEGPPPPRLLVERRPISMSNGGPIPTELSTAFASIDPQFEVCNALAPQDFRGGTVTMELELASSGAPLRVLPVGDGDVSPHSRCLMERACQYQTRASLGQLTKVRVPLQVNREQPLPPPPPPPPPMPQVQVDAISESPSGNLAELQLQLRTALANAARGCGPVPGRAQVRFLVDLSQEQRPRRPSPRQRMVMPRSFVSVTQLRTQALSGSVSTDVLSCIVSSVSGRGFNDGSFSGKRTERVLLTWNP
jgi:hypothetical protein